MADIKIRAERKAGQLLERMEKQTGGDATRARLQPATEPYRMLIDLPPTLSELGKRSEELTSLQAELRLAEIAESTGHRWQMMALLRLRR